MFQKEWEVLVVDDDPDVLAVSKLALRSVKVYGVPLKIHTCGSMAEAVELFNTKADLLPSLAVALIDVVMETDTAGLDLCRFVREERKNPLTQLFIRTGQPGVAPERAVIDRYDINGYFTKAEATEDKLYSMIKSGVRQYYWSAFVLGIVPMVRQIAAEFGSRAAMAKTLQNFYDAAFQERSGAPIESYSNIRIASMFGGEIAAIVGWDKAAALAARNRLLQLPGVPLGLPGDQYVIGDDHQLLIKVGARPNVAEAYLVATPTFRVPEFVPEVMYNALSAIASNWHFSK
ncbi:MAG: response regulator receiver protein [Comamonadaceae bacterium]|nr:response regulator receiver protein [Comamonadaceae bacterium]